MSEAKRMEKRGRVPLKNQIAHDSIETMKSLKNLFLNL